MNVLLLTEDAILRSANAKHKVLVILCSANAKRKVLVVDETVDSNCL